MKDKRFTPLKRVAIDGKTWWKVWDNKNDGWATLNGLTSSFKTRKDCQFHINAILSIRYNNNNTMLYF